MKLLLLPVLVAGSAVSPVQKVIQLLAELKTKVQNDVSNEEKLMAEYTTYCDDEITNKGFAIKTASGKIEEYGAVIEEATGKVQEYSSQIESNGSEIAAKQSELASATEVREGESKDFKAAEKELEETINTLARAAAVLKRELSFAQGGSTVKSAEVSKVLQGLRAIVEASALPSARNVESFLEADDELSLKQPQASVKNYESKSGGIVTAILDMQDKAEETLQSVRREETKKSHSYAMLKQSLEDAVANLKKEVEEATANRSTTQEAAAQAKEDLAKTEASKAADQKYLERMKRECTAKAQEWEVRQKSAAEEMVALDKAKEILGSGVKAFAQTAVKVHRVKADSFDKRDKLAAALRRLGRQFNSFALVQMASRAGADPFVKIRGMVEEMISKLQKEAQEEATQEAFCKEETTKSKKARDAKTERVDKYTTRIDKAKAGVSQLELEVADLQKEVSEIQKANTEATKLRGEENSNYKKSAKDYKDSAAAVTQAMEVLREFYGSNEAFVQQPSFGSANSDGGNMIVSFLETAQSDFTRLLAETEAEEAEAVEAYKQLTQDNKVSTATKNASIKGKTSEIKSLNVAISNTSSDLKNANEELDAVLDYLDKLKPQCESKAMSYAERKARRDAEVAGLKTALDILSGDEPALIQNNAFLSRK